MFLNIGSNRHILFIDKVEIVIPTPSGTMLTGVKTVGVSINTPYLHLDFTNQGYSSIEVDIILQDIDSNYHFEITWRKIDVTGNGVITNKTVYDSLINKGFKIIGNKIW